MGELQGAHALAPHFEPARLCRPDQWQLYGEATRRAARSVPNVDAKAAVAWKRIGYFWPEANKGAFASNQRERSVVPLAHFMLSVPEITMPNPTLSRRLRRIVALAVSAFPFATFYGCAALTANAVRATATEQRAFTVSAQPSVVIETFNGSITVAVIPENKIEATVLKTGSGASQEAAEADLKNVSVAYSQDGDAVHIVAKRIGSKLFGASGAAVQLKVPARTALTVATSNGEIASEGTQGAFTARGTNGKIDVRAAKGKLDLETSNGGIAIDATEATVAAETSNGDIHFAGSLDKGKHTLTTSNGSIDFMFPAAVPFQFAARTSNGTVTNQFPGVRASSGKPGSNNLAGLVGSGSTADIDVKLETNNGSITLKPAP
jgi:Putative adhesin